MEITSLEIDLIDACNMSCPLCNRNKHISKDGFLPLQDWKDIIDKYEEHLTHVYFLGTRSEHTLYPYFLELVEYIKSKYGIHITLSTNGDTHKEEWWIKLSHILDLGDEVRFAIDGSTQEIYGKYRVGGNLANVLKNHQAFIKRYNDEVLMFGGNDVIQYIKFNHNKDDDTTELFSKFSRTRVINSSFASGDIRPTDEYMKKYKILDMVANRVKEPKICCETEDNHLFINHNGDVSPCCHYNEHLVLNGIKWDGTYDDIKKGKHDFCTKICGSMCTKIREDLDIEL